MYPITLVYLGPLKSNGDAQHKSDIRQKFSEQLSTIYKREITENENQSVRELVEEKCTRTIAGIKYTSLVNRTLGLYAKLSVTMLSTKNSSIFANAQGDIDNRLKTIFDALSIPQESPGIKIRGKLPELTICLLEDDVLIREVRVKVGELLTPEAEKSCVHVLVDVEFVRHDELTSAIFP